MSKLVLVVPIYAYYRTSYYLHHVRPDLGAIFSTAPHREGGQTM